MLGITILQEHKIRNNILPYSNKQYFIKHGYITRIILTNYPKKDYVYISVYLKLNSTYSSIVNYELPLSYRNILNSILLKYLYKIEFNVLLNLFIQSKISQIHLLFLYYSLLLNIKFFDEKIYNMPYIKAVLQYHKQYKILIDKHQSNLQIISIEGDELIIAIDLLEYIDYLSKNGKIEALFCLVKKKNSLTTNYEDLLDMFNQIVSIVNKISS